MARYFPSAVLANRWLNKGLRVLHRGAPARLFRARGRAGETPLVKLGSDYGGWLAPVERIRRDWIVYSLGVGQDTTFDEALIERFGVTVHAFDPTPAAIEHIARRHAERPQLRESLRFAPVAVWDCDGSLRLFEPKTRGWVGSYSAMNLQGTQASIEVPCATLDGLMAQRGHGRIDLLKMDIEGAEYRVLERLVERAVPVSWLCVEFDQPVPLATTRAMLARLAGAGYVLRAVDQWNFVFEHG